MGERAKKSDGPDLRPILGALTDFVQKLGDAADWRDPVPSLLETLGRAVGVDRVTLWELHNDAAGQPAQSCRFDWAAPPLEPLSGDPRYRAMALCRADGQLDDWAERRIRGETIQILRRDTEGDDRRLFEEHGTLAFLSVPVLAGDGCWGFLGFDDCKTEREWDEIEVGLLRAAAATIGAAVRRTVAETQRRLSEERYALAARGANDGLFDWEIDRNELYFSPRVAEILERDVCGEGAGFDGFSAALKPNQGLRFADFLAGRFAQRQRKFRMECQVDLPNGSPREKWVALRGFILYDVDRPRRIVGSIRDITLVKTREAALERNRRLLRAVIDAVPAVINVKDRDSRYRLMNRFQGEVYGVDPDAAIGRRSEEFSGPSYGGQSRDLDRLVVETGKPVPFTERELVNRNGQRFIWYTAKMPLLNEANQTEGIVTVALDITGLKDAERARANLSRYVSPSMVDLLAGADQPMGPPRQQNVGILFADLIGFTQYTADADPATVFGLLREVHAMMAEQVFAAGGTLDKFTGDGLMASFGTPQSGPRDAANTLACARAIQHEIWRWNRARAASGLPVLLAAVGAHFGPTLLGNVGDERRLEFAAIGDTVNVANRLEELARPLEAGIVVGAALIEAARREAEIVGFDLAPLLRHMEPRPDQALRGRAGNLPIWVLPRLDPNQPG